MYMMYYYNAENCYPVCKERETGVTAAFPAFRLDADPFYYFIVLLLCFAMLLNNNFIFSYCKAQMLVVPLDMAIVI